MRDSVTQRKYDLPGVQSCVASRSILASNELREMKLFQVSGEEVLLNRATKSLVFY